MDAYHGKEHFMHHTLVHNKDEIPDDQYKKMVLTLMDRQAGREIATAEVFGQCVIFAPALDDKVRTTRFQNEELKHFKLVAKLMAELGVDMDEYVRNRKKAGARFTGNEADVRVDDWLDATLFNFMIDRAATFQLTEYTKGSYEPLAKANLAILRDEERHRDFGEYCLVRMCEDPVTRGEIQRRFKKWFVGSMRIFGRPGTPGNRYCVEVGLKQRDSGDIAAAYLDSIRPVMARCGLHFPGRGELPIEVAPQLNLDVPEAA
ncbi:MAG: ferritin-like fold-containing protein [Candidatus Binataceae bacterium]